jgi:hypothetical protein
MASVGELNFHCGDCELIEHCGEPYSDIAICMETRFKNVDVNILYNLLETSTKKTKLKRLDDAYLRLKREED